MVGIFARPLRASALAIHVGRKLRCVMPDVGGWIPVSMLIRWEHVLVDNVKVGDVVPDGYVVHVSASELYVWIWVVDSRDGQHPECKEYLPSQWTKVKLDA